jgi:ubiquinone biosynthesis protein
MPRDLARLVKDARHGRMRVDLDLERLDGFGDRLDSAIDRATIGVMTASLVIGSSIVMTVAQGPPCSACRCSAFSGCSVTRSRS